MPLVLTCITCRDYERYLEMAYRSVTSQIFAQDIGVVYHGIQVIHDHCGGNYSAGVAASRNEVIKLAPELWPDYLIFLDADDWIPSTYISELLRVAGGDPCVVSCDAHLFGDECRKVPVQRPITFQGMLEQNSVHCSALIPYSAFREVGGFDPSLPSHEDWDLWLRLLKMGTEFRYCPSTHLNYRRHSDSRSARTRGLFATTCRRIQERYKEVIV